MIPRSLILQKAILFFISLYWVFLLSQQFERPPFLVFTLPFIALAAGFAQYFLSSKFTHPHFKEKLRRLSVAMSLLLPLIFLLLLKTKTSIPNTSNWTILAAPGSNTHSLLLELFPALFLMASFRHATSTSASDAYTCAGLFIISSFPLFAESRLSGMSSALAPVILVLLCFYSLYLAQYEANNGQWFDFSANDFGALGRVLLKVMPIALVLYLAIPEVLRSMKINDSIDGKDNFLTGFSTVLRPGEITALHDDPSPLFTIKGTIKGTIESSRKSTVESLPEYWRGATLSGGFGLHWHQVSDDFAAEPRAISQKLSDPKQTLSTPVIFQALLFDASGGYFFTPPGFFAVIENTDGFLQLRSGTSFWARKKSQTKSATYQLKRSTHPLPNDEPRATHLALQLTSQTKLIEEYLKKRGLFRDQKSNATETTFGRIHAISNLYQEQAFEYSRNSSDEERQILEEHGLDGFLFLTRKGFCEHFAASFASILRLSGIPSRIITGASGTGQKLLDGSVLFRKSDAHAWVEAWDYESKQWLTFDPTLWSTNFEKLEAEKSDNAQAHFSSVTAGLWMILVDMIPVLKNTSLAGFKVLERLLYLSLAILALFILYFFGKIAIRFSKPFAIKAISAKQLKAISRRSHTNLTSETIESERAACARSFQQRLEAISGERKRDEETFREFFERATHKQKQERFSLKWNIHSQNAWEAELLNLEMLLYSKQDPNEKTALIENCSQFKEDCKTKDQIDNFPKNT